MGAVVIVFAALIVCLMLSLGYAVWYQKEKFKYSSGQSRAIDDGSKSVGVSELKEMIRSAVVEATGGLDKRLEAIESEIRALRPSDRDSRALTEGKATPLLDLGEEEADAPEEEESIPSRRRVY